MRPPNAALTVLHVTPHFAVGGAERLLAELTRTQAALPGYTVGVAAAPGDLLAELDRGVQFFPMPGYVLRPPPAMPRREASSEPSMVLLSWREAMREVLDSFQPDVVHAHALQCLLPWLDLLTQRQKILTVHISRPSRAALAVAAAIAGCTVSFVSAERAEATRRLLPPVLQRRIWSVANGTDVAFWAANPDLSSGERNSERVLWVGRLLDHKRPLVAVDIFERARTLRPNLQLVLVGAGQLEQSLRTRINESPYREAISLVPGCGPEDLRLLYRSASTLLLTSTREGLPMVALEAMAAGCMPVLPELRFLRGPELQGCVYYPPGDVSAAAEALAGYLRHPRQVPGARSTAECAADYDSLYRGEPLARATVPHR